MSDLTLKFTLNTNKVEIRSWLDSKPCPEGGFNVVGMSRRIEWDGENNIVSDVTEPTGVTMWIPE